MAAPEPIPAQKKLGYPSRANVNPVTDTVYTTPTKILNNNPDRIFWIAVNLAANKGYVGWDTLVSRTRGIPVSPNGGFVSCCLEEDGELTIQEVHAILENAAGTWYIIEIERR